MPSTYETMINTPVPDTNPPSSFGSTQSSSSGWLSEFKWAPYLFLIPTVGLLFVFSVLPMIYGVGCVRMWMSFAVPPALSDWVTTGDYSTTVNLGYSVF